MEDNKVNTLIGDRLTDLINWMKIQDRDFATSIGIDQSQFSKIKNNKLGITLKQLMEIISIYNVRAGWILDGEEPMFKNEKSGALRQPDHQLLTQLKKQIDDLHQLSSLLFEPDSKLDLTTETPGQDVLFSGSEQDKNQKADK